MIFLTAANVGLQAPSARDELIMIGRKEHRQHIVNWCQPEAAIVGDGSVCRLEPHLCIDVEITAS